MMTTFDDGIHLTDKFWDCECQENYIHPCTEEKCPVCGAEEAIAFLPEIQRAEIISQIEAAEKAAGRID